MLPNIVKKDGIVDFNEDNLARDPSIITAWPYPPGESFFYVDDVLQIEVGSKILYSTEAENNPAYFREAAARLHQARQALNQLLPGGPEYQRLQTEIAQQSECLVGFYQGRARVKAERVVSYVDRARRLIVVSKPFTFGYKPRIFGTVTRILGFRQDAVDEPGTDKLHKEAKKVFGTYDWQSELIETGKFPDFKR